MAINKNTVVKTASKIQPVVKQALIQNITFGDLCYKGFYLKTNEIKAVPYTKQVKEYAGKKLIRIIKIY